jgi:hypothetical protein
MRLIDHVHVARRFQRSIRIDVDLRDPEALEGFVCPQSSAELLAAMARHVAETGHGAFTWTGPYGSGKSSLVVALAAALNGSAKLRAEAASTIGKGATKVLWEALPPKSLGWRILPVVAQRAAPSEIIGAALVANRYIQKGSVRRWTDDKVVAAVEKIAAGSAKTRGGLMVVLDEMGKFLEGAAQSGHDIFLFQRLAEAAARSGGRLIVIGILHQAFDEYANRVSRDLRDEWAKVQGRFVDLVVNTAGDEQLDLIARAIQTDRRPKRASWLSLTVVQAVRAGRPGAAGDLSMILERCWPLHPVVACLLGPISRRRFGQNQRSLFGFLNSAEPFGFQDFLRDATEKELFGPDRLWDYLRTNLEPAILASPDGHRWSMAVEAVERCVTAGGAAIHLELLKTIAILDLFRERSGLSADADLLPACVTDGSSVSQVEAALGELQAWSLIVFRKHLGAYAIFAGSDFDIDRAIADALASIASVSFRDLRALAGLQPVLAKRHYHATGTFRWFDVDLVPLAEVVERVEGRPPANGATGRFLLVIPTENETAAAAAEICREAAETADGEVVVGLSTASWQVIQLAREFIAVTKIAEEQPELSGDPVARREVAARVADIRARLEADLAKMFDSAAWYRRGGEPVQYSYAELNGLASEIADTRYPLAPHLPNELVNRQSPSSNAVAALKALLKLMAEREGEPRLGIEGFPAEGGLFESILVKAALYRLTPEGWRFAAPTEELDPCGLWPAWAKATEFLEANATRTVAMAELFGMWKEPPYGIKEGLLPILGVTFLLARRDRLAVYREGIFQARFAELDVDYLATDPASIQVRWMDLSDLSRTILSGLAAIVRELDGENRLEHLEPIDVARGLVGIHKRLQDWVKRTNRLSLNAVQVRTLFKKASDPNKFLFDDIPAVFGAGTDQTPETAVRQVIARIRDGLQELAGSYREMLERLRHMMLTELQVPTTSPQALAELRARAENVAQLTGDFRLNAFVVRLIKFTGSEEDMEGIASLATNKPPRDWVDADLDQAGLEIADLAQKFIRSELFARVKGRPDKRLAMAVVVGRNGRPTPVMGEFHIADTDRAAVDDLIERVERTLEGADSQGRNIILAALAEMSAKYLDAAETLRPPPRRAFAGAKR